MDEKKTIQILQMTSKEHNNNNKKKKKKNVFIPASVEVLTKHKSLAEEQDQRQRQRSMPKPRVPKL
jgi:hypothetical protein